MDHMMPGMDGIETTRRIREIDNDYARNIPIIALTANAIVGNEEMFLNNGFQAFISKPIEIKRLDAVVREWVRDKDKEKLYIRDDTEVSPATVQNDAVNKVLFSKTITGLNIEKGITRFGGDSEAYIEVLGSFAKNTPPLLEEARVGCKTNERLAEYETIVHGVKGSSRAIFASEVGDKSEALEKAAKYSDFIYIEANNADFIETTQVLIAEIEVLLSELRVVNLKPFAEKPDEEILKKLCEACGNYDMNIADEAISELEAFSYETGGDLVEWLRSNAELTNFDEIVERLGELLYV